MATSKNNVVTHGLSGKVGDLIVFKQQNGKTIVGKMPQKSSKPPTEAQLSVNERFKLASKYAQQAILDPVLKPKYAGFAKTGQSVFNVAFADFFSPPILSDAAGIYNGAVGCQLIVKAIDNYEVKSVKLSIYLADESLLEEGEAVLQLDGVTWKYACTLATTDFATCTLTWSATDLANNTTLLVVSP
ncbi:hypothetical protein [Pedobacter arcticus]|uniref:hypothetical protein n=1 Tax=Pedobacter arcticus TaxID=752140 RepID=UPI0002F6BC23|nr:hypothetical protein [Pedobacter arcticus]